MKSCFRCGDRERVRGAYCRRCSSEKMQEWRRSNPERNRENQKRSDRKRWSANVAKFTAKRRARDMRWKEVHPEEHRRRCLQKYRDTRDRAIARLGGRCACCGETMATMLHIDHIHNDGYLEGRGRRSYTLARKVLGAENPSRKYQVLCANCNHSKARNHGLCQHYTDRWACWLSDDCPDPGPYSYGRTP